MQTTPRKAVPVVVSQHVEAAASLRRTRSVLVRAPHVRLMHLRRLDDRLAAQLDGVFVAGDAGRTLALAALESPGSGELFTATVQALMAQDGPALVRLLSIAETLPPVQGGLLSAFGWVTPQLLRGVTKGLLDSGSPFAREVGLAACAMHGVSPAALLQQWATHEVPALRRRALRYLGEAGIQAGLDICLSALNDEDETARFQAARAALLLGERTRSITTLGALATAAGANQSAALCLLARSLPATEAHRLLQPLAQNPAQARLLIQAIGAGGNPHYMNWMLKQMENPELARVAGESFSLITGLDLAHLDFDLREPPAPTSGPNDDPADDRVALDDDESLPYPDLAKVSAWWSAHGNRFVPGERYFMGAAPVATHVLDILKTGFQRQRAAAAEHFGLLKPGSVLFNIAAPAWRQQQILDRMLA